MFFDYNIDADKKGGILNTKVISHDSNDICMEKYYVESF